MKEIIKDRIMCSVLGFISGALFILLLCVVGCNESQKTSKALQPNIKPLNQQLIQTPQDWKDAYGDTFDVQVAYNFAVLRNNQLEIAKMISQMHPPVDPNIATLEERVALLESWEYMTERRCRFTKKEEEALETALRALIDPNE